jgi:RNA polymerase sigma-70 factor (ECF subfamily)
LLEKAILELKEEQKNCIELFYLQQLSYQRISEQLGISIKNVKSAIQNGKRNLKIRLEENHVFKQ